MAEEEFVQVMPGKKSGSTIFHCGDGFFFFVNSSDGNRAYLKCTSFRNNCGCRATMPLDPHSRKVGTFRIKGVHNHPPDPDFVLVTNLRERILRRCEEEPTEARTIFDEECQRVPLEVAGRIGFSEMKSSIDRARRKNTDKIPNSLLEFAEMLQNPRNERYNKSVTGDPFFLTSVTDDEGATSVIFGSQLFIAQLPDVEELHLDGTFKVRPTLPESRQLLTVMAIHFNKAFPVFFILMERKTISSYKSILDYIKEMVPNLNPAVVVTDFERSLQAAVREAFPNTAVVGCWYHSANAMRKKARSLGLTDLLQNNEHAKKAVNMAMAIPLLPRDKIEIGLTTIKVYADHNGVSAQLAQFFQYVEQTWIEGVGAEHLSVFRQVRRTNNDQEAYHRNLLRKMRHAHPNVWVFTANLRNVEHSYRQQWNRLANGGAIQSRRPVYLAQDKNIVDATNMLVGGQYTVLDFLHRTSHTVGQSMAENADDPAVQAEAAIDEPDEEVAPPPPQPDLLDRAILDVQLIPNPRPNRGRGRGAGRGRGRGRRQVNGQEPMNERRRQRGRGARGAGRGRGQPADEPQDNVNAAIQEPPQAAPRPVGYDTYRTIPTILQPNEFMELQQISKQEEEVLHHLLHFDEGVEEVRGGEQCVVCIGNKATRVASPCGHVTFCRQCALQFVRTPQFYCVTAADGDIVNTGIRLPLCCPACRCIIGQLIRRL